MNTLGLVTQKGYAEFLADFFPAVDRKYTIGIGRGTETKVPRDYRSTRQGQSLLINDFAGKAVLLPEKHHGVHE